MSDLLFQCGSAVPPTTPQGCPRWRPPWLASPPSLADRLPAARARTHTGLQPRTHRTANSATRLPACPALGAARSRFQTGRQLLGGSRGHHPPRWSAPQAAAGRSAAGGAPGGAGRTSPPRRRRPHPVPASCASPSLLPRRRPADGTLLVNETPGGRALADRGGVMRCDASRVFAVGALMTRTPGGKATPPPARAPRMKGGPQTAAALRVRPRAASPARCVWAPAARTRPSAGRLGSACRCSIRTAITVARPAPCAFKLTCFGGRPHALQASPGGPARPEAGLAAPRAGAAPSGGPRARQLCLIRPVWLSGPPPICPTSICPTLTCHMIISIIALWRSRTTIAPRGVELRGATPHTPAPPNKGRARRRPGGRPSAPSRAASCRGGAGGGGGARAAPIACCSKAPPVLR